ncbi:hypothetical protein [Burkholderia sp. Ac-20344]|uniref:hypothetical protein n=1 Tax=Burkholderia sp. Ac-20344 TaxID=2703890 RepID=UPI00197BF02A|nr:hypothetical protein [Burkholderia sp. Ac-20344]MBN3834368.1 hypothetical protein [Burkholderia sp. Ac-20344]
MIDANVRVLPESTARRRAKPMALRVAALTDEQTTRAERPLRICVADCDALARFVRNPRRPARQLPRPAGSIEFPCVRAAISRFRADSALSMRQIQPPSFV